MISARDIRSVLGTGNSLIVFLPTDDGAEEKAKNREHVSSDSETDGKSKYKIDIERVLLVIN